MVTTNPVVMSPFSTLLVLKWLISFTTICIGWACACVCMLIFVTHVYVYVYVYVCTGKPALFCVFVIVANEWLREADSARWFPPLSDQDSGGYSCGGDDGSGSGSGGGGGCGSDGGSDGDDGGGDKGEQEETKGSNHGSSAGSSKGCDEDAPSLGRLAGPAGPVGPVPGPAEQTYAQVLQSSASARVAGSLRGEIVETICVRAAPAPAAAVAPAAAPAATSADASAAERQSHPKPQQRPPQNAHTPEYCRMLRDLGKPSSADWEAYDVQALP